MDPACGVTEAAEEEAVGARADAGAGEVRGGRDSGHGVAGETVDGAERAVVDPEEIADGEEGVDAESGGGEDLAVGAIEVPADDDAVFGGVDGCVVDAEGIDWELSEDWRQPEAGGEVEAFDA